MKVPPTDTSSIHDGAENEVPKKIVLTKLSRRTKLLAYGTQLSSKNTEIIIHQTSHLHFGRFRTTADTLRLQ